MFWLFIVVNAIAMKYYCFLTVSPCTWSGSRCFDSIPQVLLRRWGRLIMRHLITALIGAFFADTPCLDGFFSGTRGSVTLLMCFLVVFRNVAIRTKWRHRDGYSLILYRYSLQNPWGRPQEAPPWKFPPNLLFFFSTRIQYKILPDMSVLTSKVK